MAQKLEQRKVKDSVMSSLMDRKLEQENMNESLMDLKLKQDDDVTDQSLNPSRTTENDSERDVY